MRAKVIHPKLSKQDALPWHSQMNVLCSLFWHTQKGNWKFSQPYFRQLFSADATNCSFVFSTKNMKTPPPSEIADFSLFYLPRHKKYKVHLGPHFLHWIWELSQIICDLSQAAKETNVVTSWAKAQNDIYFTQHGQSCHFVNCSACTALIFFSDWDKSLVK